MGFIWEKNRKKQYVKKNKKIKNKKQNIMKYVKKERQNDNSSGTNEEDEESMIGFHQQERKKYHSIKRKYPRQIYKKIKNLNIKYLINKIIKILQIMCLLAIIYFLVLKL